jgi:hypothetical protein
MELLERTAFLETVAEYAAEARHRILITPASGPGAPRGQYRQPPAKTG